MGVKVMRQYSPVDPSQCNLTHIKSFVTEKGFENATLS